MIESSIEKPLVDKKSYRHILLENGAHILLINEPVPYSEAKSDTMEVDGHEYEVECSDSEDDSQSRLAAAALCVNVGSFADPKNFQGLAHFLEHMLFLGSEKYPTENHLDEFLKTHSGHSNACTEGEHTIYYFDVSQDGLREALDIFASCLSKPLLRQNAVEREVNAVHSEYEDNLLEDSSRRLQLFAMMAKENHPFACFPFGNTKSLIDIPKSLGLDINTELRSFFDKYYTADRMYIVIESHHSLDEMESWVHSILAPVRPAPQKALSPQDAWTFPFNQETYHRLYRVCPARDMHELVITWALPSQLDNYKSKPHHYLSFIIGDESPGSLISFLRKKRLALQLVAGNDESCDEHNQYWCKFSLNIQLTDEGMASYEQVLRYVFSYLEMMRTVGPQERIFDELKLINQFRFDYQDETEAIDNVNNLCQYMKLYPVQHVLNGSFIFTDWEPKSIEHCLSLMQPSACNIIFSSKFFESSLKDSAEVEPWFHTRYSSEPLKPSWWANIKPSDWEMFSLPAPNNFIPKDFTVKNLSDHSVKQLPLEDKTSAARLWYKPSTSQFAQPKACVSLILFSDVFCNSIRNRKAVDIYLSLLQLDLIEKLYPASVCGLKCSIKLQEFSKFGINIRFTGFSDKLPALIDLVLNEIVNFKYSEDMFNIISGEIERECRNSCISPMDLAHQVRLATLLNDYSAKFQRLAPQSSKAYLSVDDFEAFLNEWRESRGCMLDCFISGNVDEKEARSIFGSSKAIFQRYICSTSEATLKEKKLVQKSQCAKMGLVKEPIVCAKRFSVEDDDNFAVVSYYQFGVGDFKNFCIAQLFEMIVSEPCFNILRTQKQLGYNCFLEMHDTAGTLGFSVTVQSSHTQFNPKIVEDEVESFMKYAVQYITTLPASDFEEQVSALIELKLTPFSSLKAESRYYWSEIVNKSARMFDRREKEIEMLATLTQAEVIEFGQKLVTSNQKLTIQVIDPVDAAESFAPVATTIQSPVATDRQLMLCRPKAYETGVDRFVREFTVFKQSLVCNPHVDF